MKWLSLIIVLFVFSDYSGANNLNAQKDSIGATYQGSTFYDTALYFYTTGNFDTSLVLFKEALKYNKEAQDTVKTGETLNRIAIIYREQGNYSEALKYFQDALNKHETAANPEGIAQVNNSIGILYMAWKNYKKALSHYNIALSIYNETNNNIKHADVLNNIGLIYRYTQKYDSALVCFKQSLIIRQKAGDDYKIATSLHNIGIVYNAISKYDLALDFLNKALKIREKLNAKKDIAVSLNAIGNTYMNLQQFQTAEIYFKKALEIALQLSLTESIIGIYENMTLNYSALEDHENFRKYFDLYIGYYDSVFNEDKHRQLMELQTKYETEKKEQQIKSLEQENRIQQLENKNNRLLLVILVVAFIVLLLFAILFYSLNKIRSEQRVQLLRQKMLRLQMNPHFLFNAMGAIQEYIYDKEPLKAASYLSNFSKLMRFILESSKDEYITLSKEIEMLEYYIELQKLRFKNEFNYSLNIGTDIDPEEFILPPMLLQPFVENSIEHGLKRANGEGLLSISVKKLKEELIIKIKDNGIGLKESAKIKKHGQKAHRSMSFNITKERLVLFNKKNKTNISFSISEPEGGGTLVKINIPVLTA